MPDALAKLIRLSSRHQLPVIVHDSQSGESAVLMNLDEFEKLAKIREEIENSGFDLESDFDEDEGEYVDDEDEELEMPESDFAEERGKYDQDKQGKFSGIFEGKNNFPAWNETVNSSEEPTIPWTDPNFASFYDERMQMAHDLHRDKLDIDLDNNKQQVEDFRYEPNRENAMFPAFSPQEDDGSDEEPIFFEEPV